jgi:molybdenum cofactor biosynthesis enzyme MoaA
MRAHRALATAARPLASQDRHENRASTGRRSIDFSVERAIYRTGRPFYSEGSGSLGTQATARAKRNRLTCTGSLEMCLATAESANLTSQPERRSHETHGAYDPARPSFF